MESEEDIHTHMKEDTGKKHNKRYTGFVYIYNMVCMYICTVMPDVNMNDWTKQIEDFIPSMLMEGRRHLGSAILVSNPPSCMSFIGSSALFKHRFIFF